MRMTLALLFTCASVAAAPNMMINANDSNTVFACSTLNTLDYAERMKMDEPLSSRHKAEVNNSCYPFESEMLVTAFDIGVASKVEVLVLDELKVLYINTRDLKRLDQ